MINPDRMRRVDRWIGAPVCFALTLVRRLARPFRRSERTRGGPQNVLFIELAEMGSTVLAWPAIKTLKSTFPDAAVYFLVFSQIAESLELQDLVAPQNVLTLDAANLFTLARDTVRFMIRARHCRLDTVINLEAFTRYSAILSFLSGARTRVGFHPFTQPGLYTGDLLTHRVPYNVRLHTSESFVALASALAEDPAEVPGGKHPVRPMPCLPKRHADGAARREIARLLREAAPAYQEGHPLVVINPNASKLIAIRKWPLEYYARLVARIIDETDWICAIVGVESEKDDARYILDRVSSDRIADLTGRTSLVQLVHLFDMANVLVTNDSGPAHFAALTGVHVIVFFGPETPTLYRPLTRNCTVLYSNYACSPCVSAFNQRVSPCTNNMCLKTIDVDTVYGTLTEVMQRSAADAPVIGAGRAAGATE